MSLKSNQLLYFETYWDLWYTNVAYKASIELIFSVGYSNLWDVS